MNDKSWDDQVRELRESGAKVIAPNNLPIKVIRHDGTLLEHEAAEHPDYKFPVTAEYIGTGPVDCLIDEHGNEIPLPADIEESLRYETHALIYADECVAVTIYECCYHMWSLSKGKELRNPFSISRTDWRLDSESLNKIKAYKEG